MKFKFINTINGHYIMKKRLYKVYATYNYLDEIFYCVKARKYNFCPRGVKQKYAYIEPKIGMAVYIPFGKDKILTRKEFVRFIKKQLKTSRQYKQGNNIREFLENRVKRIKEFRKEFTE